MDARIIVDEMAKSAIRYHLINGKISSKHADQYYWEIVKGIVASQEVARQVVKDNIDLMIDGMNLRYANCKLDMTECAFYVFDALYGEFMSKLGGCICETE